MNKPRDRVPKTRLYAWGLTLDEARNMVDDILQNDHKKSKALHDWAMRWENIKWFLENKDNIKLVLNGIELFWYVYDLKDTVSENVEIWKAKRKVPEWKKIPDWGKLGVIPANFRQSFFEEVLWLSWTYLWSWKIEIMTSKNRVCLWNKQRKYWKLRLVTIIK